jgi:hypothetical protein
VAEGKIGTDISELYLFPFLKVMALILLMVHVELNIREGKDQFPSDEIRTGTGRIVCPSSA